MRVTPVNAGSTHPMKSDHIFMKVKFQIIPVSHTLGAEVYLHQMYLWRTGQRVIASAVTGAITAFSARQIPKHGWNERTAIWWLISWPIMARGGTLFRRRLTTSLIIRNMKIGLVFLNGAKKGEQSTLKNCLLAKLSLIFHCCRSFFGES